MTLSAEALSFRANYVTVEIGENDLCGNTSIATFRTELKHGLDVDSAPTSSKYPGPCVKSEPVGMSLRSRDTYTCTVATAVWGGASPQAHRSAALASRRIVPPTGSQRGGLSDPFVAAAIADRH